MEEPCMFYTFYNKGRPVAVVRETEVKNFSRKFPQYENKKSRAIPKLEGWFEVEQPRGRFIGYFSRINQPSSFLEGEFFPNPIPVEKKE